MTGVIDNSRDKFVDTKGAVLVNIIHTGSKCVGMYSVTVTTRLEKIPQQLFSGSNNSDNRFRGHTLLSH